MADSKTTTVSPTISELDQKESSFPCSSDTEGSINSTSTNPFDDPKVAQHYRDLYDKAGYECRHVFDPDIEWTAAEERKIVRKIDWHVATWACIMFFALNVDRKNLTQAVSDNMLNDLNMTTADYNIGKCAAQRICRSDHHRKYTFPGLISDRRTSLTAHLEEAGTRQMDSDTDGPLVDRGSFTVLAYWSG